MKLVTYPEVEPDRLERIRAACSPMVVASCASEADAAVEIADADAFFGKLTPEMLSAASASAGSSRPPPAWSISSSRSLSSTRRC